MSNKSNNPIAAQLATMPKALLTVHIVPLKPEDKPISRRWSFEPKYAPASNGKDASHGEFVAAATIADTFMARAHQTGRISYTLEKGGEDAQHTRTYNVPWHRVAYWTVEDLIETEKE